MKNLILILFIGIGVNTSFGQDFDGSDNLEISLEDNEQILLPTIGLDSLEVAQVKRDASCGSIELTRADNLVTVTLCSDPFTLNIGDDTLKFITANGKYIAVSLANSGGEMEGTLRNQNDDIPRNIYWDAYILSHGSANETREIFNIWGINPNENNYFSDLVGLQSSTVNKASDAPSGILGFNVTMIADGFAKFLVSRVKKELAISFFKGVKDRLNDDSLKDIQTLFQQSHLTLQNIDEEIYNYQVYLPALKQSFEADLGLLPNKFSLILQDQNSQISTQLDTQDKMIRPVISTFLDFGISLANEDHLGKAIAVLPDNPTLVNANPKFLVGVQSLALISEALRDTFSAEEKPYWIDKSAFNKLIKDPKHLNCFIGLMLEKARKEDIRLDSDKPLWEIINAMHTQIQDLQALLSQSHQLVAQVNDLRNLRSGSSTGQQKKDLIQYFNLGDKMVQLMLPIDKVFNLQIDASSMNRALLISRSIQEMVKGFTARQYSYGLLGLTKIIEEFNQNKKLDPLLKVLRKEVLFIAQIAEANSSDEVAAVIENFAAPVGSWRDKRNAQWNVAFDSYVGPGAYWPSIPDRKGTNYGVSTPIGFSLTTPIPWLTFMGSIVDIGPMVAFRFADDENNVPDTYLKEIIAPGIFTSINLDDVIRRDFIFKVNVGYQQFPLLKEVDSGQNTVCLIKESGFTINVGVNIPIMTLYNKN